MERKKQTLEEILANLKFLDVDWRDDVAIRVIAKIRSIKVKSTYDDGDITGLLQENFDDALLIFRLFLGLSKDQFMPALRSALGGGGCGIKRYQSDPDAFVAALLFLGIAKAMKDFVHRLPHWSDILAERLRSGRGSAISGQKRGRDLEDFVQTIVHKVFETYATRCDFVGVDGHEAKCDFAIPEKNEPKIVIETKGYAATGSKMTDILGDIKKIIKILRRDTVFLLFTDGLTWNQRQSDLKKIIAHQNQGRIFRIYTFAMAQEFEADLLSLKAEYKL